MLEWLGHSWSNDLLFLHNITSFSTVVGCWWVSHQYARARPPGRLLAGAFAVLGMSLLLTMVGRNLGPTPELLIVLSKVALAVIIVGLAIRNHHFGKDHAGSTPQRTIGELRHALANTEFRLTLLSQLVRNGRWDRARKIVENGKSRPSDTK